MGAGKAGGVVRAACARWLSTHAPAGPVVVACSGGADSLALTVGVLRVAGDRPVIGASVDHGLQAGSAERAARCVHLLRRLGCADAHQLTVTVDGAGGLEAAARRARYRALRRLSDGLGGAPVLLGHTRDDQAETVLLGLARGSGPRSIAGMRPSRPPWGRPLLTVTRAQTEAACAEAGLTPWIDPHNADSAFTRVRVRREVLPLLDEVLGGGVRDALARTADLMAEDLDALDAIAAQALAGALAVDAASAPAADVPLADLAAVDALSVDALSMRPAAVRRRVLRTWLAAAGAGPLTHDHLTRLDRQLTDRRGPAQVRVPGGLDVWRRDGVLRIERVERT